MPTRDFELRPQGAPPDSVPYQNWLDTLGQRQNIDLMQELTSVASGDEIPIFDVSETGQVKTKKATVANIAAGAGAVIGPASATDNAIVRYDGTTGKLVQNSGVIIGDTNNVSGIVDLVATGTSSFGTTVTSLSNSNTTTPKFIYAASGVSAVMQGVRHTSPGGGGFLAQLCATRGTAANDYTIVQSGDGLGTFNFQGSDGSQYVPACQIVGAVDGTPGANDMPGRLVFLTTADGAATPTERMRIANGGNIYCTGAGTTASAANAFLNSGSTPANELLRSTSSLRYKANVEPIEPQHYNKVLDLKPIWYRSKAKADNPNWSYYGLGAEDVAAIDPRLVNWGYAAEDWEPKQLGEDGGITHVLKDGAQLKPDGVSYERLAVLMIPILKEAMQRISALEAQVKALQSV